MPTIKKPTDLESMFLHELKSVKVDGATWILEFSFATFQLELEHNRRKGKIELLAVSATDVCRDIHSFLRRVETRLGFMLFKGEKMIAYLDIKCKRKNEKENEKKALKTFSRL